MKFLPVAAIAAGLAAMAALVGYFGAGAVLRSLFAVGWDGFAVVCLIHLAMIALMGVAWRVLLEGTPTWVFVWGRLVRESGSEVLPLSQVGGYVLGARAVALCGVGGAAAAASTIVDVTLEFFAQLAYTAIGVLWLVHLRPGSSIAVPVAIGLAAAGTVAAAFLFVQRRGFGLLERMASVLGRGWADRTSSGAALLHAELGQIYTRRRAGVWGSFVLHLACWIASAAEVWVALRFAGAPLDFGAALVIESVLYAIRTVAFAIPNAVGVQEGAYVLVGATFGLSPEMALALSLLKRARDTVIGLPVLGVWQTIEGGRLWRRLVPSRAAPERAVPVLPPE